MVARAGVAIQPREAAERHCGAPSHGSLTVCESYINKAWWGAGGSAVLGQPRAFQLSAPESWGLCRGGVSFRSGAPGGFGPGRCGAPCELFTENFRERVRRVLNDKCSKPKPQGQPPKPDFSKPGESGSCNNELQAQGRPRPAAAQKPAISAEKPGTCSAGAGLAPQALQGRTVHGRGRRRREARALLPASPTGAEAKGQSSPEGVRGVPGWEPEARSGKA